ncbi:MAG: ATP-binding protein [Bacteroidales bacterium]|jgi:hypothetical protein|nr:ATP-binding protein [Bacteroidales bacterium]
MEILQKKEILQLIEDEKQRLGSYRAVASKCKISEAAISQLRKGSYAADGDDIYRTIGLSLGYSFADADDTWRLAETSNYLMVTQVLEDARNECLCIGISHKAGSGKTSASSAYLNAHRREGVFKINCMEWTAVPLLSEIAREIGAEVPRGYSSNISGMITGIATAIKAMRVRGIRPLIILDQANSLKQSAFRSLIHLDNKCEDLTGVVILGTENLEYAIKRGVRLFHDGYDEFDSRFGRKYIHLSGAPLSDVRKICEVNGITDREQQKRIFDECEHARITLDDGRRIEVVEDIRRLKRIVKREKLNGRTAGQSKSYNS